MESTLKVCVQVLSSLIDTIIVDVEFNFGRIAFGLIRRKSWLGCNVLDDVSIIPDDFGGAGIYLTLATP